jgi:hypothetical protein
MIGLCLDFFLYPHVIQFLLVDALYLDLLDFFILLSSLNLRLKLINLGLQVLLLILNLDDTFHKLSIFLGQSSFLIYDPY